MLSFIRIVLAVLALSVMSCSHSEDKTILHDENGNVIELSQFKGNWVFVNYWAAWCRPCVEEIPALSRFARLNKDKHVVVLGVNYDHLPANLIKQNMTKMKMTYRSIIEDPAVLWNLDSVDVLPTTYIINPNGKVVKALVGPHDEKEFQDTLADLSK